jgi:hypothetical protein
MRERKRLRFRPAPQHHLEAIRLRVDAGSDNENVAREGTPLR